MSDSPAYAFYLKNIYYSSPRHIKDELLFACCYQKSSTNLIIESASEFINIFTHSMMQSSPNLRYNTLGKTFKSPPTPS